jgi:uncharacterized integral membrane protein
MTTRTDYVRLWAKTILLFLLAAIVIAFLLLNMNAIVEPRVHMVFFTYERPGLLPVLLLAAVGGAVLWGSLRAVPRTVKRFHKSRVASQMAGMEREIAELKADVNHPAPAAVAQ